MIDRRTGDRSLLRTRVKLQVGEDLVDAQLADYSTDGARLRLTHPLKVAERVVLVVGADRFSGVVRYCTQESGRGEYTVGLILEGKNDPSSNW